MPLEQQQVAGVCMALAVVVLILRNRRRGGRGSDSLDRPLLRWTKRDVFSVRDLLNGGLLILGITGGGKSSSSGKQVSRALIRDRNTFGLILAAKPEDLPMWKGIFKDAGQSDRLLVFDTEQSPLRFNFLDEAARYGGSTRDITQCITTIAETLRAGDRSNGGGDDAYWVAQQERTLHQAVEILKHARGSVNASDLHQFISTAAQNSEQIRDTAWRNGFHSQCLQTACANAKKPLEQHDVQQAMDFWAGEVPTWADRTRSSIMAGVFATLFVFNSGVVFDRVSTKSNFSFDEMRRKRQWLLVNTPPSVYGDNGTFIGSGFKYLMQRFVLSQAAGSRDPIHVCWVDEAQQWTNQFDAQYIAQSRSHRGCMVFLTQSIEGFHSSMKSQTAGAQTQSLLSNFAHRIIHAVGSVQTAEWASNTLGNRLATHIGGSSQPADSVFDEFMGHSQCTSSFSTQYDPVIQPAEFMNGLRTGGPENGLLCDAFVIRPGKPFSNGENWIKVTFSQR